MKTKMSKKELVAYIKWMCDPENERNCSECPENVGFDDWQGELPCGQQNCWVSCHCEND